MISHIVRGVPYFTSKTKNSKTYPPLQNDISTDVVIVGGGITGILCAYYFSREGINTVVVEKNHIAQGSTSITTSLLQYELDDLIDDLEKSYMLPNIIKGYKFGAKGLKKIEKLITSLNIQCDYVSRDCLLYTNDTEKINKLYYEYEQRHHNRFDVAFIEDNSGKFDFSFDIKAGVYAYNAGAEIDPVKFTNQLAIHAENNGAKIFENTEVKSYTSYQDSITLKTTTNNITCKKVIIATGYDISDFTLKRYAKLSTTYNIVTSPIENITGWNNNCLIKTAESTYSYLRTTPDNRIIIGGEDTRFIPELLEENVAKRHYKKLEEKLGQMFPHLTYKIDYSFNGVFGTTPDNLGYIGPNPKNKNIWYCLGYGANGILFSTYGAKMLSKLYKGVRYEDLELVSLDR